MVDIKGLDKAQVLKALYVYRHGDLQKDGKGVTVEDCEKLLMQTTHFAYLNGRAMDVDLSGDEFDPRTYDLYCGEGAAQRVVDTIRDKPKGGEDNDKDNGGEKKEPSIEERAKKVEDAVSKIVEILTELPPDEYIAAVMYLKIFVLSSTMTMPKLFTPPASRMFAPMMGSCFGGPDLLGRIR